MSISGSVALWVMKGPGFSKGRRMHEKRKVISLLLYLFLSLFLNFFKDYIFLKLNREQYTQCELPPSLWKSNVFTSQMKKNALKMRI